MEVLARLMDKARGLHTIASSQTIEDAICLMADRKARALLVMENDQAVGMFSEADLFKCLLEKKAAAFSATKLKNAMTRNLILAETKDPIATVLDKMVAADISHLPVLEEEKLVGMLTLEDVMKHQINTLVEENHQLKDYIADLHEAGQD